MLIEPLFCGYFAVTVIPSGLWAALQCFAPIAKSRAKLRGAQFVIGPAPGGIELIGPGAFHVIAGEGSWPGRATVGASLIMANLKVPPTSDLVVIRTDMQRLWIGGMSAGCLWRGLDEAGGVDPLGGPPKPEHAFETLEMAARLNWTAWLHDRPAGRQGMAASEDTRGATAALRAGREL